MFKIGASGENKKKKKVENPYEDLVLCQFSAAPLWSE